jgi:hypothetical protein
MASILSNTDTDPVGSPLHPSNIFCVDGLVVLITGGGTGGSTIIATPMMWCEGYGVPANGL